MKKNNFTVRVDGMELVLPKSSVNFVGDYGKIEAYSMLDFGDEELLMMGVGVVNKKYEVVVNLVPKVVLDKLDILNEGIIIYRMLNEVGNYNVFMARYVDSVQVERYDLTASDYEIISEKFVKLKTVVGEYTLQAICNIKTLAVFEYFNYIGEYFVHEEWGMEVAEAVIFIYDDKGFILDEISCFIDKEGEIITNFYSRKMNVVFEETDLEKVKEKVLDNLKHTRK